jgi:hypothetical protein
VDLQRWNIVRAGVVVSRIKARFLDKSLGIARKIPGFRAAWEARMERDRALSAARFADDEPAAKRDSVLANKRSGEANVDETADFAKGVAMSAVMSFIERLSHSSVEDDAKEIRLLREMMRLAKSR